MILRGLVPALALNLALLIAPSAILGRLPLEDPRAWVFLTLASAMILADAPTIGRPLAILPNREGRWSVRWAAATGGLILLIFWASLLECSIRTNADFGPTNLLGGFLMSVGVALRAAAVRSLGPDFITEPGSGPLVERRLYARIRHPSEAGNLAVSFGAACLLGSSAGLAIALLALLPIVVHRIRVEDRDLRERHGERFDRYARRVGALVPRFGPRSRVPASAGGAIGRAALPEAGSGETGACGPAIRGSRWGD